MATTKITSPDLFNLDSLNTKLRLPSGTTAQRPTSPSSGEWRFNTSTNLLEMYDGSNWFAIQDEDIPPIPSENFSAVLYTGTGSAQSITGVGFQPDMVWIKDRIQAYSHNITDTSRGTSKQVFPNNTNAQDTTYTNRVTSFDADGFTIGNDNYVNTNGNTFVAWCWKANGGTTSSNTDGAVTTTVQVNEQAGFSIVEFSGTGSETTFGHGLGEKPSIVIIKRLDSTSDWPVYHDLLDGSMDLIYLNSNGTNFNSSRPLFTSSVFYFVTSGDYIAYCFAEKTGYSKFGSYTGNGAAGNEQNTGFEPAFVLIKRANSAGAWSLYDNKRSPSNPRDKKLVPNSDAAENNAGTTYQLNFLTNGFNFLGGGSDLNANGGTYIYIAFAADPSAAPVLADSYNTNLYTGNDGTQSITGLGFQPDFVWIKHRNQPFTHALQDSVRGIKKLLRSSTTNAEYSSTNPPEGTLTSFDSDGFTIIEDGTWTLNASDTNYVSWNWKANPIPTINTDGTIQSLVSANQASGFSIVKLTGTGSAATIGHGLSAVPEMIIVKHLNGVNDWWVYNKDLNGGTNPASYFLKLNTSDAEILNGSGSVFQGTSPTSSVFYGGTAITDTGREMIAYCFKSISGFSKIGSYTGNGSAGHAITGLGFQPNFILIKGITSADNWFIFDSARGASVALNANLQAAEYADTGVTSFDSDGFTLGSGAGENRNGDTYIYMAFKENPTPYPLAGNMSFLVVAGGGGGGYWMGAGGGAGGLRTSYGSTSGGGASAESDITLAAGTYTITVGAAGSGMPSGGTTLPSAGNGGDSSIAASGLTTITSIGGGGGGAYAILQPSNAVASGANGGSGGGAWSISNQGQSAGTGTANQGYAGALGGNQGSAYGEGTGGGGGAAGAGTQGISGARPNGGNGLAVEITGSSIAYAGGGGGATTCASPNNATNGGLGGTGGGGNGGYCSAGNDNGGNGTTNTGGGGGGSSAVGTPASSGGTAGNGGSGVVILRLLTSEYSSSVTGSPTVTTDGDYTVLTYTGSGTYVHS